MEFAIGRINISYIIMRIFVLKYNKYYYYAVLQLRFSVAPEADTELSEPHLRGFAYQPTHFPKL